MSVLLSATELALSYGHAPLLESVTLVVKPGEKVGLVGRNGCGKTSLLKILAGERDPDRGEVSRRRGLRIGYLPQDFELDDSHTVHEAIQAGAVDLMEWIRRYEDSASSEAEHSELLQLIELADGWNLDARIKADVTALNAPALHLPVGPLSGGEKRRVALCRALISQPDLLLLDEPTNHLDAESIQWLENFLRTFKGAVVFVTHDRYFLDVIATRLIEISRGEAYSHPGNYSAYLESQAQRQHIAGAAETRRQRFLRSELEFVRAGVRAQRSKSRFRLENFDRIASEGPPSAERDMDLALPVPPKLGNIAIEASGVSARVGQNSSPRWLFRDLSLSIKPGQCTGVIGRNGTGKTTLLRILMGEREPDEGSVAIGKRAIFNSINQDRSHLDENKTIVQEIANLGGETVTFGDQTLPVRSYLKKFLFEGDRIHSAVRQLSGGERARLLLAKEFKRGGNIIVLDEPTNDLDLSSLRMLEAALIDFSGSVIVVSHDRYFLDRVCDQIVAFEDSGPHVQPGNYSYYLEKLRTRNTGIRSSAKKSASAPASRGRIRKLSFKEQGELAGIENAIAAAETKVNELETLLDDPSFYITRSQEAAGLQAELESGKTSVAALYERWEKLEAIRANS